jgi:hypothetical protein
MLCKILHDSVNQLADAAEAAGQDRLLAQVPEKPLDQVHPGGAGGRKMQFETRMARQPALDDRMFMGGVVVQNDVDVLAQGNFLVDSLEEFQPLAMGMFLCGVGDDFTL